jgi:hypothetical protein
VCGVCHQLARAFRLGPHLAPPRAGRTIVLAVHVKGHLAPGQ